MNQEARHFYEKPLGRGAWQRLIPWLVIVAIFFLVCVLLGFAVSYYIAMLLVKLNI